MRTNKTIKLTKILLTSILFLGISSITLNAQDKKIITAEDTNTTKEKSKNTSDYKSYQQWNSNYSNDKYQRGSISTH